MRILSTLNIGRARGVLQLLLNRDNIHAVRKPDEWTRE